MLSLLGLLCMVCLIPIITTQETVLPGPQCQSFTSSIKLSADQIISANISNITAHNVEISLNFERNNWATNSVIDDSFYRILSNWSSTISPGSLLAVENVTNTSLYTLPASVSLSRITYQTLTLNGTAIPASAYVLWPYLPRTFANITGLAVIGWAHGASGMMPDCAPSHIRNLWYQYSGPFVMALQGYVVVAPDYAGLGIGSPQIRHPYLSSPAHAHDLLYAIRAAQSAFPSLSHSFVTIGHSQGGGAAWAAATLGSDISYMPGHLGTVGASPAPAGQAYLTMLSVVAASGSPLGLYLAYGIHAAYSVPLGELLTPAGQARWALFEQLGGCNSVAAELFATPSAWVLPNISSHWAAHAFAAAGDYSGKAVRGPLLVLQGLEDGMVLPQFTEASVEKTCRAFAHSAVEYVAFEGVTHVPVMYAGQHVWLDWVADRFNGVPAKAGCRKRTVTGIREEGEYLTEFNYFLNLATAAYQVA